MFGEERKASLIALVVAASLLGGCGGTTRLLVTNHQAPPPPNPDTYLTQMSAEQARLAAAERRIPARPRTSAALSRSIGLLAAAVGRLGDGLAAVQPPPAVAAEHARLISIIRRYAAQLRQAAMIAVDPGAELRVKDLLISNTDAASGAFAATAAKINTTLGR